MRAQRSRGWTFTVNNYSARDIEFLDLVGQNLTLQGIPVVYLIYGKEIAPTTNTPHLQSYIHFVNPVSMSTLLSKITLSTPPHYEASAGNAEQNKTYCSKEGNFKEFGVCPKTSHVSGKDKSPQETATTMCINLAKANTLGLIEELYPQLYVRYYNLWHKLAQENAKPFIFDGDLQQRRFWLCGETGCGKSSQARKFASDRQLEVFTKLSNKWWDGYRQQPVVIIDELSPRTGYLIDLFKQWTDRYSFPAEIKGGTLGSIWPQYVFFTSQYTPEECFSSPLDPTGRDIAAIRRRFKVIHFRTEESITGRQRPTLVQEVERELAEIGRLPPITPLNSESSTDQDDSIIE